MDSSGVRFGTSGARGLVADMSDEVCFAYTTAFLETIRADSGRIALAIDLRPSSPGLAAACAAAIRHAGLDVDYCGAIPTPALAFYSRLQSRPAIMVTGSHIPFDRNGIKFYGRSGEITKEDEIRISQARILVPGKGLSTTLPAVNESPYRHFTERYLDFFSPHALAGMKLGFYEHSSVGRDVLRGILESLGAQVISLGRTDEFVPIDTEAVSDADSLQAQCWASEYAFDAIVSTDGDADRPLIGDEKGRWLRGDVAGILCARYLGAKAVSTTVNCNTAIDLCGSFHRVCKTRIGSPYVIEGIDALLASGEGPVVGFEPNGGFLVGSSLTRNGRELAPLMTRDAVLPILSLLSMARESGCRVSEISSTLPARFTASDRLQSFPTETSRAILQELASSVAAINRFFSGLCGPLVAMDQTDGLRMFLENDEIVHFRPSGNAPELRCYAESSSQARSGHLVQESLQRLKTGLNEY